MITAKVAAGEIVYSTTKRHEVVELMVALDKIRPSLITKTGPWHYRIIADKTKPITLKFNPSTP